ncbi:unnamed protein product [Didymodactylos carnosus]|uniref:Reverse transcriptase domain-containing protein n=1 Tax=Didymodactylos carnosus TaxID=1234261 RepID=A0A813YXJ5_9BILA|nr:unnamed protein product [Didymodactylos carnosus]CAF3675526.1 unnamed protein product [Didymodactylos carnosus]
MGAPLAPLMAELFMQGYERKHMGKLKDIGVKYWRRYVDDTIVLLKLEETAENVAQFLNKLHPSIKFTFEEENASEHTLPFLDVLVKKTEGYTTSVYRKPSFTGLMTKWLSFIPKRYKRNAISTMVYRAFNVSSTYQILHNEFDVIRVLARKNGYPLNFVEKIIRDHFNHAYTTRSNKNDAPAKENIIFRIPYFGQCSQIYAKRITAAVKKVYPQKDVRIVYDVTKKIGDGFKYKG